MSKSPLYEDEVRALVGDRDYLPFLNPRNELYRERGMRQSPPSREEALRLMAEHPNLIRRPLLVKGAEVVYGFDEAAYRRLITEEA